MFAAGGQMCAAGLNLLTRFSEPIFKIVHGES